MNTTIDPFNITLRLKFLTLRNRSHSLSAALKNMPNIAAREVVVITLYSILILISIFGNLLVCNIVARSAKMRSSTYVFIANLALSDLMMTVLNIPFNVTRLLLNDWPFGSFMCSLVPLVQVTSVYVSTFTMTCIAVDRYRIISKPLEPRLRSAQAIKIIICVWLLALVLSLPHAIFNRVEKIFTYRYLVRCRSVYPLNMSRWITLTAVVTQYVLPLSITGILYYLIMLKVWSRNSLGVVTEGQRISQAKAKKKTIKMLFVVVVLFALCWLPLNVFNILREFKAFTMSQKFVSHSTIFFMCHGLAMSSVCYNPFIYCWLNDHFRAGALRCLMCMKNAGRHLNRSLSSNKSSRLNSVPTTLSVDYKLESNQDSAAEGFFSTQDKRSNSPRIKHPRQANEFEIPLASLTLKPPQRNIAQASLKRNTSSSKYDRNVTTTLVHVELQDLVGTENVKNCSLQEGK